MPGYTLFHLKVGEGVVLECPLTKEEVARVGREYPEEDFYMVGWARAYRVLDKVYL